MKSKRIEDYIQFSQLVTESPYIQHSNESIDPKNSIKLTPHFFFLSLFVFDRQEEILYIYIYKAQQSTHNIQIVAKRNKQAKEREKLLCCAKHTQFSGLGYSNINISQRKAFQISCVILEHYEAPMQSSEQRARNNKRVTITKSNIHYYCF